MDSTSSGSITLLALAVVACVCCGAPASSELRLIAVQDGIALKDTQSGRVLGRFLRPEIDERTLDDVPLKRISHSGSPGAIRQRWHASEGFDIDVSYTVRPAPERVVIRVSAVNTSAGAKSPYVLFPFEIERPLDFPKLISFTQSATQRPPFVRPQPGEGLSAFWGCEDYNLTTCDYEMFAPVAAVTCEDGAMVAGCAFGTPSTFRLHRSGRFELFHHFFLGGKTGNTDDGAALITDTAAPSQKAPYEFYIGRSRSSEWQDIYRDWYVNLQRSGRQNRDLAELFRKKPDLLDLTGLIKRQPVARQETPEDAPSYVRFNEQTPARGLLTADSDGAQKLIAAARSDDGVLLLDLENQGDGAKQGQAFGFVPFYPVHQADASLMTALKAAAPQAELICRNPHPASPAYRLADAILASSETRDYLQEKLQTGYTPLVCWFAGSDGTQDRALAEACFFGCGAPEWAWSKPEIGLQAREACELAQAALMGGSLEAGTLHYRSQRGALFVTLRNATPKREALKTRFAGLSREAAGRRYALRIWKSGEGSGASEEMSGPTLAARELKVSLNPGQIAVVSALPAGGE